MYQINKSILNFKLFMAVPQVRMPKFARVYHKVYELWCSEKLIIYAMHTPSQYVYGHREGLAGATQMPY